MLPDSTIPVRACRFLALNAASTWAIDGVTYGSRATDVSRAANDRALGKPASSAGYHRAAANGAIRPIAVRAGMAQSGGIADLRHPVANGQAAPRN